MPFIPCFLPPIGALPNREGGTPAPSLGAGVAAAGLTIGAALLLFTPVGWSRSQPVYEFRTLASAVLPLQAQERRLAAHLPCKVGHDPRPCTFSISPSSYGSAPPGLILDPATGTLSGTPMLPGTYTLAIQVADSQAGALTGPLFKIRVLPGEPD